MTKIKAIIEAAMRSMTEEESAVAGLLAETPITQREIARHESWIGTHPKHEGYDAETTTRMVRQIIRVLRVQYRIPILSCSKGYFITDDIEASKSFLERMEGEVRARNKSSLETYSALNSSIGIVSEYFDRMRAIEDTKPLVQATFL